MSWIGATWRGLLIVAFVCGATVWLPEYVLGLDAIASASSLVRDLVVVGVWGAGFAGALWVLRRSQRRGLI